MCEWGFEKMKTTLEIEMFQFHIPFVETVF